MVDGKWYQGRQEENSCITWKTLPINSKFYPIYMSYWRTAWWIWLYSTWMTTYGKKNKNVLKRKGGKNFWNTIQVNFEVKLLIKYDLEIFIKFFVQWLTADHLFELVFFLFPFCRTQCSTKWCVFQYTEPNNLQYFMVTSDKEREL